MSQRYVVLERGTRLWRVLDRYTDLIDYVGFDNAGGLAIVQVPREAEARLGGVREYASRLLDLALARQRKKRHVVDVVPGSGR